MQVEFIFDQAYYVIKKLDLSQLGVMAQFCVACSSFYELYEGRKGGETTAREVLESIPEGHSLHQKQALGVFDAVGKLVAMIEIVSDYPTSHEWIIALLMVDPEERRKGLGRRLHEEIVHLVRRSGGTKLRAGVVLENVMAIQFWKSMGYEETARKWMRHGNQDHMILVMNRSV
ncbi:MAG: GNAT family N-acetyltransferase [Saprospiraceae bacterium]|nr:GNAT family N-acetyltransferase [Saprospiraceae bacterium]